MLFAASLSHASDASSAATAAASDVQRQLAGAAPDVVFVFLHASFAKAAESILEVLQQTLAPRHILGCTAESVAGGDQEVEQAPAISLWAAVLPDVQLETFHVTFRRTPDGLVSDGLPDFDAPPSDLRAIFLLGDPYTCAVHPLIDRLAEELPGVPLLGGMASGGGPGEQKLIRDGVILDEGGVGLLVRGAVRVESVVSQGCRPVGPTFIATRGEKNLVFSLGGKPALERLQEVYTSVAEPDRELIQQGLHLGIAMNEYQERFEMGDFLISNVQGFDRNAGVIAIGNLIRTGQTVRFHVRDARTADEELRTLLDARVAEAGRPQGALLFTCNGRGTRLFPQPHHDAAAVQSAAGPLPLAGFFAQGELGPVAGKNHIHGFTASIALFYPPSA